ncbi:hemolysin [Clostridium novyi A str. 4570]|uniref:Hemolysin n=1 Tax=Clostridium novyi A str. 4570 TaxID=1444290 RepID=A0AA88ZS46_CLONO|nr:hemolysin III family protein [Clostridium novyi]KGN02994.1 hemolysin [Clostridium novyi A str. 4570]
MNRFREPVSGFTHLFGVIISIVGLIVLINYERNIEYSSSLACVAVIIFGISLILLYTASSVYHLIKAPDKVIKFLRRIDHSMIYVLIAGTYTPVCLITLQGKLRWIMFSLIWTLALSGVLFKIFWFNSPRWLSTLLYIFMGWIAVFIISPLAKIMDVRGIELMFIGGVLYTLGAVIYATKWPRIKSKVFGFHEIFHLFVLAGSFCHYFMVLKYIL